jgi:sec-independent protein translocase protein TatC
MTTSAPPTDPPPHPPAFNPDAYRMTIGEHLEELRTRLILALVGFAIAALACFWQAERVIVIFCRPLLHVLQEKNLNTQLFYSELGDGFMVYVKISVICAAVISAPWMLFQIWKFVAAGLYPGERKYVTRYIPLSIALLISGMLFVYFVVLPWTISFFISFADDIPMPTQTSSHVATTLPAAGLPSIPQLDGDPASPIAGQFWYNKSEGRLKMAIGANDMRVLTFGPNNLLAPHISLPDYIDLVVNTLLTFGLCFQLPLVVLAIVRIGIINVETFKRSRRYVYFGISILAAAMTPGDMVTAMIALMLPLILLFELGIFLAVWNTNAE